MVRDAAFDAWAADQTRQVRAWADTCHFRAGAGEWLRLPAEDGRLRGVVLGLGTDALWPPFPLAPLADGLPAGVYALQDNPADFDATLLALGWALGAYRFDRFRSAPLQSVPQARLALPEGADGTQASSLARAIFWVRDLINTPANHMGPAELETAARSLAREHGAEIMVITGEDLLQHHFPLIHAVGRTAAAPPRLIDLTWGAPSAPRITLVGKGVCFDTGGLNLKPGSSMDLMKKDMGGAAHVLGLARLIMETKLNVRLRAIIPAVENAVGGNAFRPGDILPSRQGQNV